MVKTDDGRLVSAPTKQVTLFSQKVVLVHNATMAQVTEVTKGRAAQDAKVEAAKVFCASKGLDAETLTEPNLFRLMELLA